jgi:hypothetical protein
MSAFAGFTTTRRPLPLESRPPHEPWQPLLPGSPHEPPQDTTKGNQSPLLTTKLITYECRTLEPKTKPHAERESSKLHKICARASSYSGFKPIRKQTTSTS